MALVKKDRKREKLMSPLIAVVLLVLITVGGSMIIYIIYEDLLPSENEVSEAERARAAIRIDMGQSYTAWALAINVSNSHPTVLNNYAVMIKLTSLNFANWSQLNPNTVYFTLDPEGNTPLYYWLEDYDPTTPYAVYWVNMPSIPAGPGANVTIYMWISPRNTYPEYNNPGEVFVLFDHFDGPLNSAIWDTTYLTNYTLSDSVLRINVGGLVMSSPLPFRLQDGYAAETKVLFKYAPANYSGTVPSMSSSPSTSSGNGEADATILYMRNDGLTVLSYWAGSGNTRSYDIGSGSVTSTVDDQWYVTGIGVNDTAFALWLDNPHSPVFQQGGITWVKDMTYVFLGAFNAADDGSSYDIQDTLYDWVRIRKWVFPEPSVYISGDWHSSTVVVIYVRNVGTSPIKLDHLYAEDAESKSLVYSMPLSGEKLNPGQVKKVTTSFTGEHSGTLIISVVTEGGSKAKFTASPD